MTYHNPVLLEESVAGLSIKPNGVYVDVTFGGGGHSRKVLEQLGDQGKLFAFDQDVDALENTIDDNRFLLIHQNFRHIKRFLKFYGITQVDGILGDFGVSSHQFDVAERGFSTRFDAALDMRMNQESAVSALHIINEYSESDLRRILFQYGDLKSASGMARMLVESRQVSAIATTDDLKKALGRFLPKQKENKILAQVFQAVRIEVNQEIQALKEFLLQTVDLLPKGGRLSLISYHSLEDRLVKRFIRDGKFEGQAEKDVFGNVEVPYKKVGKLIVPSEEETKENNRARSAKLRIAQRL
jgi:16S rRNA (cytosine1402-N4)-methyltransferase